MNDIQMLTSNKSKRQTPISGCRQRLFEGREQLQETEKELKTTHLEGKSSKLELTNR